MFPFSEDTVINLGWRTIETPNPSIVDPSIVDPSIVDPSIVDPSIVDPSIVDPPILSKTVTMVANLETVSLDDMMIVMTISTL